MNFVWSVLNIHAHNGTCGSSRQSNEGGRDKETHGIDDGDQRGIAGQRGGSTG